jgi:DNA-binding NtrC family response regulator
MGKRRALVIDDEQIVLDSVKKILSEGNYEVEANLSGQKGLERAIQESFAVILTDIRMPDIGGMLVLRDIKRAKPSLPVLMITGHATILSAVQAMKLGAADYIEKPFTPDELLKAVDTAIEAAATQKPEDQEIIHKEEILRVLERAATDSDFLYKLLHHWADALDEYDLTGPEKLALLTGDREWIEKHAGPLSAKQIGWLERSMSAEKLRSHGW